MYVKEYGRGARPYAAFHGWGGSHREFVPLAARLPAGARLISFDLPGYGDSPEPPLWEPDAIAAALERELEIRTGGAPVTLIGFCSGGVFALLLARRRPESVERIVLIDPFAYVPWYFRIFLWGEFGRMAYVSTFETRAGRALTDRVVRWWQKQDADFTAAFRNLNHEAVRKYLELFQRIDMRQFGDLRMPVDLFYGENTFAEVRQSVDWYGALWPQARRIVLRDVGHLPLLKGAQQLASAIFGGEGGEHES
jgi:pimeloyl-ACP methyl ester carboxylesterase